MMIHNPTVRGSTATPEISENRFESSSSGMHEPSDKMRTPIAGTRACAQYAHIEEPKTA